MFGPFKEFEQESNAYKSRGNGKADPERFDPRYGFNSVNAYQYMMFLEA